MLLLQLLQDWHYLFTGATPGRMKVKEHHGVCLRCMPNELLHLVDGMYVRKIHGLFMFWPSFFCVLHDAPTAAVAALVRARVAQAPAALVAVAVAPDAALVAGAQRARRVAAQVCWWTGEAEGCHVFERDAWCCW
jgi:hypothetical protein